MVKSLMLISMIRIVGMRKLRVLTLLVSVFSLIAAAIATPLAVSAWSYSGSGGFGGDCTPNWCTGTNGSNSGWKKFSLTGGGPGGNGGNGFVSDSPVIWADVKSRCGTIPDLNVAWIFVTGQTNGADNFLGLNYVASQFPDAGTYVDYDDASPGTVHGYFIDAQKADYAEGIEGTWGTDVSWFCYSDNPPWYVTVTASPDRVTAEPGQTITWTHKISVDAGSSKTNKDIAWKYVNHGDWVTPETSTTWVFSKGKTAGKDDTQTSTYLVKPADFGRKICRTTTATPSNHNAGTTEAPLPSPPSSCVTIVKKPKVQVLGGDLKVAGNVQASSSYINNTSYGSWGEFGMLATGTIEGFSSGAAVQSGKSGTITGSAFCNVSLLSFNNLNKTLKNQVSEVGGSCGPGDIGAYPVSVTSLASILTSFSTTQGTFSGLSGEHKRVESYSGSTLTINGGTIPKGEWLVINAPTTTVTITGNITYATDELNAIGDIPQLVILAKNIHIAGSVTQVDSWLIASGDIVTCNDVTVTAALTANICKNQLTVNGPVSAGKLFLRRTFGAGPTANAANSADRPTTAAEVFNVRPDATLWAIGHDTTTTPVSIATSKELPPRF